MRALGDSRGWRSRDHEDARLGRGQGLDAQRVQAGEQLEAVGRLEPDAEIVRLAVAVLDVQREGVRGAAVRGRAEQHARGCARPGDRTGSRARERPGEARADQREQGAVDDDPRAQDARRRAVARGRPASGSRSGSPARPTLLHHAVAGVDALGAGDALELQALADVDSRRADRDAEPAVDAVARSRLPSLPRGSPRRAS